MLLAENVHDFQSLWAEDPPYSPRAFTGDGLRADTLQEHKTNSASFPVGRNTAETLVSH